MAARPVSEIPSPTDGGSSISGSRAESAGELAVSGPNGREPAKAMPDRVGGGQLRDAVNWWRQVAR